MQELRELKAHDGGLRFKGSAELFDSLVQSKDGREGKTYRVDKTKPQLLKLLGLGAALSAMATDLRYWYILTEVSRSLSAWSFCASARFRASASAWASALA